MAGTLKVDNLNADSNLALKIANTAVGYIDSTGLRIVNGNLVLSGTTISSTQLSQLNANGTISAGAIASINASVATTGTLPSARLPSSSILQAITSTDLTERSTTSTSFVTASNTLSVTITPSSTSSKIFVVVTTTGYKNTDAFGVYTLYRDSTNLGNATNGMQVIPPSSYYPVAMSITDSPNTTSAVTYQVYFRMTGGSGNAYLTAGTSGAGNFSSITAFEIKG